MPSEPDAASETVAEAEIEAGRCAHSRVDIDKLIIKHVQKGGVVTIDTGGVITFSFKTNEKRYGKELSRDAAIVEARRGNGQGDPSSPARTVSAKKMRDRARNTHAAYLMRQERRQEERQRQTRAAETLATAAQVTEATFTIVDLRGEVIDEEDAVSSTNAEGAVTVPERAALFASPGKRRVVESHAAQLGSARATAPMTTSKASEAISKLAAIDAIKAATRKEKRELEAHEADQRKRMQSLSRDFSRESNKVATTRTANTAASTTGKGITRNKSKGVTMSYASAVYKALTRGERMLLAARG